MQRKNAKEPAKKPSPAAKASPKPVGKPVAKITPATKGGKVSPPAKPAAKDKGGTLRRGEKAKRSNILKKRPIPAVLPAGMSLDRKLDITGMLMATAGLLTLLVLVSSRRGEVSGGLVGILAKAFGYGMYVLPVALILVGLWLVLRNFERIPLPSAERLLGVFLLYTNLLSSLHWFGLPETRQISLATAELGRGGGYAGALVLETLRAPLGLGGAAVALLAWFLIGLALALDVSVPELFRWLPPALGRLQEWLLDLRDKLRKENGNGQAGEIPEGYLPLSRDRLWPEPEGVDAETRHGVEMQQAAYLRPSPHSPYVPGDGRVWVLPNLPEILDAGSEVSHDDDYDRQRARVIEETLASFGAPARVIEVSRGPTITQFGVEPDFIEQRTGRMRVRVGKIAALADDLALALSARTIRIQAPVPGKGYVGIEVPNDEIGLVALRDVIESEAFKRLKSPLRFGLGQDVAGNAVAADLAGMPHLLVAGATGSGKSVCVNAIICCLLLNNTPDDLRLIMVDPKRVELSGYNGIPHLLAPVVTDLERVTAALQWVTREMDQRYHKLAQAGCRNIKEYNNRLAGKGEKRLPYLVVIIDELADLMMLAPDETERTITRLAQLARATGIHLLIATQRPSVDVVTGLIKANFPARIAFAVASGVDSRVILDQPGAERLLGRGDMLFQAPDAPAPARLQGAFVGDSEIQRLVSYWQAFGGPGSAGPMAAGGIVDALPSGVPLKQIGFWEEVAAEQQADPLLNEAIDLARRQGRASISMLQRRLRIGYTRAARLVESMEQKGIVGPPDPNTGTREILDYGPAAPPVEEQGD